MHVFVCVHMYAYLYAGISLSSSEWAWQSLLQRLRTMASCINTSLASKQAEAMARGVADEGVKRQIERELCTQPTHTHTHKHSCACVKRSARNKGCHSLYSLSSTAQRHLSCACHISVTVFCQMVQVLECNFFCLLPNKQIEAAPQAQPHPHPGCK